MERAATAVGEAPRRAAEAIGMKGNQQHGRDPALLSRRTLVPRAAGSGFGLAEQGALPTATVALGNGGADIPTPERFLMDGSFGDDLTDDQLLVFPIPGYPALVLHRVG